MCVYVCVCVGGGVNEFYAVCSYKAEKEKKVLGGVGYGVCLEGGGGGGV